MQVGSHRDLAGCQLEGEFLKAEHGDPQIELEVVV